MKPKTVGRVSDGQQSPIYAQDVSQGLPIGLRIQTSSGSTLVEDLRVGDKIVTRNGGLVPLTEVQTVICSTNAVRFAAGCFARNSPDTAVILPEDQSVLIRDRLAMLMFGQSQALTSAGLLADGRMIENLGPRKLTLIRLRFDKPRVFYVHGLELCSEAEFIMPHRAVA